MKGSLAVLIAVTTVLAMPLVTKANQHSRNVGGEAARDTSSTLRSEQAIYPGWRYVGGEAVWIWDSRRDPSAQRSREMTRGLDSRAADRPQTQRVQGLNDIYHGA